MENKNLNKYTKAQLIAMLEEKQKADENSYECLCVTNVQVFPSKDDYDHVKGKAIIVLNDQFIVRDLRIKEGENGLFVSFTRDPLYSENFRYLCNPLTRQLREHIETVVLEKYQKEVANG